MAAHFISLGVKLMNEEGEILAVSSATMIPVGDSKSPNWASEMGRHIATLLPTLLSQAQSDSIRAIDPAMKLASADMLEKLAKSLRKNGASTPQVFIRSDDRFEEVRVLTERKG